MRYLRAIGSSLLVLSTGVLASSQDDSLTAPSLMQPPDRYHDVILPQIYDAMSKAQLRKNEPAIKQGFNESSFYLPTWPDLQELKIVQNGTAIRVPPLFWRSALELDYYPTPEALRFLFEEIPLTPKTAAFHGRSKVHLAQRGKLTPDALDQRSPRILSTSSPRDSRMELKTFPIKSHPQ